MSPVTKVPFTSTWTLMEALQLHNRLLPVVKEAGFGLGLTGGILRNCHSEHDIDVIFYPLQAPRGNVEELKAALQAFGMRLFMNNGELVANWRRRGSEDNKWVEVWELEGKRIDVFFLR